MLRRLLLISAVAAFVQASAQQQPTGMPPSPADAPGPWKVLLGEYTGADTLLVFEAGGRLMMSAFHGETGEMTSNGASGFTWRTADRTKTFSVTFQRTDGSRPQGLTLEGAVYRRRPFDGEDGSTFHIKPLFPFEELLSRARSAQPPAEAGAKRTPDLVELRSLDSSIHYDIRYATTNNFMQQRFYSMPRAYLQRPAAEGAVAAHRWLRAYGYGLLVHDAYRPWYVTKMFWDATPGAQKETFVADPAKGSRHNRGCALDVSLYRLDTGAPADMVSGYDEFSERAFPSYAGGTSLQRWHRQLLRTALERVGFKQYEWEWWHFDFNGWNEWPIGTKTFEELGR